MKPGKPTTFASVTKVDHTCLVFALPGEWLWYVLVIVYSCYTGNAVSCFVTFYLYVLPSLRGLSGFASPLLPTIKVRLAADVSYIDFRDVSNV